MEGTIYFNVMASDASLLQVRPQLPGQPISSVCFTINGPPLEAITISWHMINDRFMEACNRWHEYDVRSDKWFDPATHENRLEIYAFWKYSLLEVVNCWCSIVWGNKNSNIASYRCSLNNIFEQLPCHVDSSFIYAKIFPVFYPSISEFNPRRCLKKIHLPIANIQYPF